MVGQRGGLGCSANYVLRIVLIKGLVVVITFLVDE